MGDPAIHAKALLIVASACKGAGDVSTAVDHYRERLELSRKLDAPAQAAMAMNDLSWCLLQAGRLDEAEPPLHEALALLGPDQTSMHSSVRHSLAALALIRRDPDSAERLLRENLRLPNQDADEVAYDLEALVIASAQRRQADRALRLAAAVHRVRDELGMRAEPWWQHLTDQAVNAARDSLPAGKAAAATDAGSRLTLDQAVAAVLEHLADEDGSSRERSLLTAREQQVAALVARGLTNAQIAQRLGMSGRTVVSHLEHIRAKLDLPSRAQVAVWAAEHERVET
jgi:non-specific serine/threonine protein kinase